MIDIFCLENNHLKRIKKEEIKLTKSQLLWVDIINITPAEKEFLEKKFMIHHLILDDFSEELSSIKVEEFSNYLFCIFYGVQKSENLLIREFDFILGKNFLITNHKENWFNNLKENSEELSFLLKKGPDFLFHTLLDNLVDSYFPVLDDIEEKLDHFEEEVTITPKKELASQILHLKKELTSLRKYVFPQRDKISSLATGEVKFIKKDYYPYYRNLYDHTIKIADFIDSARDEADTTFEIYMSAVSNNMNEVMKFLSIIATTVLPLTVISGIYGTNFHNLPGSVQGNGFWVMIGAMGLLSLIMILNFKRKKWF